MTMDARDKRVRKLKNFVDKMPSLSTTVSKVLEICSRTDTSPNDLNKVISLDPVLTGQVLKLINSAYYSLVNKVTSLTRAIIMLGLNTVKNLALSTAIIRCVGQTKKSKILPVQHFWAHSICVGVLAKLLAIEKDVPPAQLEEYFVAGLLHDLGKIPFGDEYIDVLKAVKLKKLELINVEQEMLDLDHQDTGWLIADKWKLNQAITDAICCHHSPREANEENRMLVTLVALADFFACVFDIGYAGNLHPDPDRLAELLEFAEMQWSDVSKLAQIVEDEIQKAEIFLQV